MVLPDLINAIFNLSGGFFIGLNIRSILHHKCLKGTNIFTIIFFTSWGIWNLFYFSNLQQAISFYCGIVITLANIVWLGLAFKYRRA